MNDSCEPSEYLPANAAERTTLEARWARGDLHDHAVRLVQFVDRHRSEILAFAGAATDPAAKVHTIKQQIVRVQSVCTLSEMQDQTRAIHDEIWFRGERGEYDRRHIAHEWASRHAAAWRRWRLKEYLFVVDRCAEAMLRHLEG